jgi:hypothetical protein
MIGPPETLRPNGPGQQSAPIELGVCRDGPVRGRLVLHVPGGLYIETRGDGPDASRRIEGNRLAAALVAAIRGPNPEAMDGGDV